MVACINDAVGDDIKEDIVTSQLITHNNTKFRIWDILYSKVHDNLTSFNCEAGISQRGPWQMVVAYDNDTGLLFTFMREQRYKQLRNTANKRKRHHYLDALAKIFNGQLSAPNGQTSLFPEQTFSDEDKMSETVERIILSLSTESTCIQNHVLVLFESFNFSLTSVRAIIVDSHLNSVYEQSWNEYISINESSVVDKVDEPNSPANNPSKGLKLTAKATARKQSVALRKEDTKQNNIG